MATIAIAQIDQNGNVIATSVIESGVRVTLPPDVKDITNHPERAAIEAGDRRWSGSAWVVFTRPARTQPPQLATLTDRQLLERIAIALGVARP